jgi:hypothetical protein
VPGTEVVIAGFSVVFFAGKVVDGFNSFLRQGPPTPLTEKNNHNPKNDSIEC